MPRLEYSDGKTNISMFLPKHRIPEGLRTISQFAAPTSSRMLLKERPERQDDPFMERYRQSLSDELCDHPEFLAIAERMKEKGKAIRTYRSPLLTVVYRRKKDFAMRLEANFKVWKQGLPEMLNHVAKPNVEAAIIHVTGKLHESFKQQIAESAQHELPPVPCKIIITESDLDRLVVEVVLFGFQVDNSPPPMFPFPF